jgi:uncharacterized membrane protein
MNPPSSNSSLRVIFRFIVAAFFIFAGVMHFVKPALYLSIMPPMLPDPLALVNISGVFEILGGVGLLMPALRRLAGYGLILLLIAVFPANVYMLTHYIQQHGYKNAMTFVLILRLPLQYFFAAAVRYVSRK